MPKQPGHVVGFGFSSGDVKPDLSDLDHTLARFQDCGASHCELNAARYELVVNRRLLPDKVRLLKKICSSRQLKYTVHSALAVNFMDRANLELHKDVFRAMLRIAGEVEASILVHHPGRAPMAQQLDFDALHELERNTLYEMGDLARSLGVKIGVETLFCETPDRYTPDPFRLANEIERVGHDCVVGTLDISHAFIQSSHLGIDFREGLRRFARVANHVHVHDSFGQPAKFKGHTAGEDIAYGLGDLHLPPGWGSIPWEEILAELDLLPGTVLNVEMRPRHFHALRDIADFMRHLVSICGPGPQGNRTAGF